MLVVCVFRTVLCCPNTIQTGAAVERPVAQSGDLLVQLNTLKTGAALKCILFNGRNIIWNGDFFQTGAVFKGIVSDCRTSDLNIQLFQTGAIFESAALNLHCKPTRHGFQIFAVIKCGAGNGLNVVQVHGFQILLIGEQPPVDIVHNVSINGTGDGHVLRIAKVGKYFFFHKIISPQPITAQLIAGGISIGRQLWKPR